MHYSSFLAAIGTVSCLALGVEAKGCRTKSKTTLTTSTISATSTTASAGSSATGSSTVSSAATSTTTTSGSSPTGSISGKNYGFDDSSSSYSPWALFSGSGDGVTLSIDSTLKRDGPNSIKLSFPNSDTVGYIAQDLDGSKLTAGIAYELSGYFRDPHAACTEVYVLCMHNGMPVNTNSSPATAAQTQWAKYTIGCYFSQASLNSGSLQVVLGWSCKAKATVNIDTVGFTSQDIQK